MSGQRSHGDHRLFPTICEFTKTTIPKNITTRGISFVPQLHNRPGTPRLSAHHAFRKGSAVTDDQWRLDNSGNLRDSRKLPTEPKASPGLKADEARIRLKKLLKN